MHSEIPSQELISSAKTAAQSSTRRGPRIIGKLLFAWSWFVAAMLLLIVAPPVLLIARLANKPEWVYPITDLRERSWQRMRRGKKEVKGEGLLEREREYELLANDRSYFEEPRM